MLVHEQVYSSVASLVSFVTELYVRTYSILEFFQNQFTELFHVRLHTARPFLIKLQGGNGANTILNKVHK